MKNIMSTNLNLPVTEKLVKANDEVFFIIRDVTSLDIWSQIVQPSQSATLPASL